MRTTKLIFNFEHLHALPHLTHRHHNTSYGQCFWGAHVGRSEEKGPFCGSSQVTFFWTCTYTNIYMYAYYYIIHTYTLIHTHIPYIHTYIHTYIHSYTHISLYRLTLVQAIACYESKICSSSIYVLRARRDAQLRSAVENDVFRFDASFAVHFYVAALLCCSSNSILL